MELVIFSEVDWSTFLLYF